MRRGEMSIGDFVQADGSPALLDVISEVAAKLQPWIDFEVLTARWGAQGAPECAATRGAAGRGLVALMAVGEVRVLTKVLQELSLSSSSARAPSPRSSPRSARRAAYSSPPRTPRRRGGLRSRWRDPSASSSFSAAAAAPSSSSASTFGADLSAFDRDRHERLLERRRPGTGSAVPLLEVPLPLVPCPIGAAAQTAAQTAATATAQAAVQTAVAHTAAAQTAAPVPLRQRSGRELLRVAGSEWVRVAR